MNQEQYENLLSTYDMLLDAGKINDIEHAERVEALNMMYVKKLNDINIAKAEIEKIKRINEYEAGVINTLEKAGF